jgi:hypothetical protein
MGHGCEGDVISVNLNNSCVGCIWGGVLAHWHLSRASVGAVWEPGERI